MCPKCNVPMIVVEFQGVEVDHCPDCRGTWFDAGELELVAELAGAAPGGLEAALTGGPSAAGRRRCPRCNHRLHVRTVGDPPIEVDRCPAGEGIWLDAGELARVVRTFSGADETGIAAFFGDLFRHELSEQKEDR